MKLSRLQEFLTLAEGTSAQEQKVLALCKKHGCNLREYTVKNGVVHIVLTGDDDYSDIGKVFESLNGRGPQWRRAMNVGYVKFTIDETMQENLLEARRASDLTSLIEKWQDAHKIYSFEGSRGERNFTKLVNVIGYRDLSSFFEDNPGAFGALVEWIGSMRNTEWVEAFQSAVDAVEDDNEDK